MVWPSWAHDLVKQLTPPLGGTQFCAAADAPLIKRKAAERSIALRMAFPLVVGN
jgi:hypothetical protein